MQSLHWKEKVKKVMLDIKLCVEPTQIYALLSNLPTWVIRSMLCSSYALIEVQFSLAHLWPSHGPEVMGRLFQAPRWVIQFDCDDYKDSWRHFSGIRIQKSPFARLNFVFAQLYYVLAPLLRPPGSHATHLSFRFRLDAESPGTSNIFQLQVTTNNSIKSCWGWCHRPTLVY